MKRLLLLLLLLCSIIYLFSCADIAHANGKTEIRFFEVEEADAKRISDSLGLTLKDGEKLCLLLKNAGLEGNIDDVIRYTDGITGLVFYRVRSSGSAVDVYFYSDGSIKMKNGNEEYLFDAADVSVSAGTSTDTVTDSDTDAVSDVDPAESSTDTDGKLTFIVNTSSKKYHRPDCRGVGTMSEENKKTVYVHSESELWAKGYAACGICGGD